MVLIYSHIVSSRLKYICDFIFREIIKTDFNITTDQEEFRTFEGIKINYSNNTITDYELRITNHSLLFEDVIIPQEIKCFEWINYKCFFKTEGSDFPFDIFAASFYLLSRYEEYLHHKKDLYGRYAHKNSLAFKEGFIQLPLINIWIQEFIKNIKEKFSTFSYSLSGFNFIPTYDIDIAYSYKYKGFLRNMGGFLKSPSLERLQVLSGFRKDPFDVYDWLDKFHQHKNLCPIYFFLVPKKNSRYDKNILPHKHAMQELIKYHAQRYSVGLHPSWRSGDNEFLLKEEQKRLEAISGKTITISRQHYIRFNLPEGYRKLIDAGITDDYSMGYGTINGFRASVASSFYWYDLEEEKQTGLRIHPFCFMDANSFYQQRLFAEQTYNELMHYFVTCKSINGNLITIWHNNFLGSDKQFFGWREMYEQFITQVQ